jgi:hypothetical protein
MVQSVHALQVIRTSEVFLCFAAISNQLTEDRARTQPHLFLPDCLWKMRL